MADAQSKLRYMEFTYVVPLQRNPSREEREWAWRLSVIARAAGRCQTCDREVRLDAAHITARRDAPEREWDPENGMALCRSCHMKHDHANGHRPSGRPVGYRHTKESRKKMSESARVRAADPLEIARRRQNAIKQWDGIGRKPDRDCDHCGTPLTRRQVSGGSRFCSAACHYEFRRGKARSGY